MEDKKWYSIEDVELAASYLDELPDLTKKRLTKIDVLEQLKEKIINLADNKGYSIEDIRIGLNGAGIKVSLNSIREIINSRKKTSKRSTVLRKKTEKTPESVIENLL